MPDRLVTVIKNGKIFGQTHRGAHYYAFSPVKKRTEYSEAFANIVLPSQLVTNGNTGFHRNAYISLGISGPAGGGDGIDLGLKNDGSGWYPCYNNTIDGVFNDDLGAKCKNTGNLPNAIVVARNDSNYSVHFYVMFTDAKATVQGPSLDIDVPIRNAKNIEQCRFFRFASLVPEEEYQDTLTDGTKMIGGKFTNTLLYNKDNSEYDNWGIDTDLVSNAWIMSNPKCQVFGKTLTGESFTINHS